MHPGVVTSGSTDQLEAWVRTLAGEIGPRRPTSRAERTAAEWARAELAAGGLEPRIESFAGYATFAAVHGTLGAGAVLAGLLPRALQPLRSALAASAAAVGALEEDLRWRPLSGALARAHSANLVAEIEPDGPVERTVCVVGHLDSSRSGLLFATALAPHLRGVLSLAGAGLALQGAEGLLARSALGRRTATAARAAVAFVVALLVERELRGEDVPGANDNASGCAVAAALALEVASERLDATRVVLLLTGCEESGLLGIEAFLDSRDTREWLFLNFDGVGAPATLRYLPEEGLLRRRGADPTLISLAGRLAQERPELGLAPATEPAGLTYDATAVMARGGRALTISAQDGGIPNYHRATDTAENLDHGVIARALEVGRELISAIDRGEADLRG